MSINNHDNCPLTQALLRVGGKWKPLIIFHLYKTPKRFGQLDAVVPKISRKVLTSTLNELIRDELVNRKSYSETPPRVEYSLTEKARELVPIFQDLADWGMYLIDQKTMPSKRYENHNCFVPRSDEPYS